MAPLYGIVDGISKEIFPSALIGGISKELDALYAYISETSEEIYVKKRVTHFSFELTGFRQYRFKITNNASYVGANNWSSESSSSISSAGSLSLTNNQARFVLSSLSDYTWANGLYTNKGNGVDAYFRLKAWFDDGTSEYADYLAFSLPVVFSFYTSGSQTVNGTNTNTVKYNRLTVYKPTTYLYNGNTLEKNTFEPNTNSTYGTYQIMMSVYSLSGSVTSTVNVAVLQN